ncbi:hypothetical protein [Bifidobacterium vespertilionis]|uniref:Uncharacterized protein n=1 Tax=Bifidobacterium vespertilionis TaxID=2562524 RepID=A0A5J5DUA1_9BIFI|nr:hypothetical protein [Bifidobacterium vespertilionis]KAA8819243.1 hypothetical protein EMO90_08310 [Bifidobacterium vespertilionis]KAA8823151.1 hypothetical protein EM848_06440 [Bifidobacterium vespertilionis]MBT1178410.1 hypothetical protein [Bifidobacterium vespertilionis]
MSNFVSARMSSKTTVDSIVFFMLGILLTVAGLTISPAIPTFPASVLGMVAVVVGVALAASLYGAALCQELNR